MASLPRMASLAPCLEFHRSASDGVCHRSEFEAGQLSSSSFGILETFMADLNADATSAQLKVTEHVLYDEHVSRLLYKLRKLASTPAGAVTAFEVGLAYLEGQKEVEFLLGGPAGHDGPDSRFGAFVGLHDGAHDELHDGLDGHVTPPARDPTPSGTHVASTVAHETPHRPARQHAPEAGDSFSGLQGRVHEWLEHHHGLHDWLERHHVLHGATAHNVRPAQHARQSRMAHSSGLSRHMRRQRASSSADGATTGPENRPTNELALTLGGSRPRARPAFAHAITTLHMYQERLRGTPPPKASLRPSGPAPSAPPSPPHDGVTIPPSPIKQLTNSFFGAAFGEAMLLRARSNGELVVPELQTTELSVHAGASAGVDEKAEGSTGGSASPGGVDDLAADRFFTSHFEEVKHEHTDNVSLMRKLLHELEDDHPLLISSFKERACIARMLHKQREVVEHMMHEGTLVDLDGAPIVDEINKRLRSLYLQPVFEAIPFTAEAKRLKLARTTDHWQGAGQRVRRKLAHAGAAIQLMQSAVKARAGAVEQRERVVRSGISMSSKSSSSKTLSTLPDSQGSSVAA